MKIVIDGLKKDRRGQRVVDIDSFEFRDGRTTVIVGKNGTGKTTLFGLIAGTIAPDSGRVVREKGSLALLEQEFPEQLAGGTLFDVCADACAHLARRELELHELEARFATLNAAAQARYAELAAAFERDGGWDWRREVRLVLEGIGFSREEIMRPAATFSGGQKRRALLARALVGAPDVLLLDEPTNHLDLEAIAWLESWLRARRGTTIVISHDRHLIDAVADEIVEYRGCRLERYPAPFSAFRAERARRSAELEKHWKAQREFIDRTEDFIRRNIAGQKTKQAQSRRKMLEKIELLEPPERDAGWRLALSKSVAEGKIVAEGTDLVRRFGEKTVLDGVSFKLYRGEKIAITGRNGSGKSTLLKTLLGEAGSEGGCVRLGELCRVGYFPQEGGELDPTLSVLDEIWREMPAAPEEEMRTVLGAFLFSGEAVEKKVGVLSGGEKSRLLLAKLFLRRPNLLVMDEPTNHLDLESRVLLENALADFDGSVIFVSHDRAFVDAIATAIWHLHEGRLERFEGNLADNVARILALQTADAAAEERESDPRPEADGKPRDMAKQAARGANRYKIGKIEEEIAKLEEAIRLAELEMQSGEAIRDGRVFAEIAARHAAAKNELDARYGEWEEACS